MKLLMAENSWDSGRNFNFEIANLNDRIIRRVDSITVYSWTQSLKLYYTLQRDWVCVPDK